MDVPNVGSIDIYNFTGQRGSTAYYVSYADYPAEIIEQSDPIKILEGSRDGASQSVSGKVTSDKPISLDRHPGREITVEGKDENGQSVTIKSRIFLVDNRLYQIMVISPQRNFDNNAADTFLQSFKLLGSEP